MVLSLLPDPLLVSVLGGASLGTAVYRELPEALLLPAQSTAQAWRQAELLLAIAVGRARREGQAAETALVAALNEAGRQAREAEGSQSWLCALTSIGCSRWSGLRAYSWTQDRLAASGLGIDDRALLAHRTDELAAQYRTTLALRTGVTILGAGVLAAAAWTAWGPRST
jgi:hypothetical protein